MAQYPEKRVNGRQPDIARRDEVVPVGLQMLEEGQDVRRVEVFQIQLAHGRRPVVGHKAEEEHETVSIAEDRMRTAPSDAGQVIGEKPAERAREDIGARRVHRAPADDGTA